MWNKIKAWFAALNHSVFAPPPASQLDPDTDWPLPSAQVAAAEFCADAEPERRSCRATDDQMPNGKQDGT